MKLSVLGMIIWPILFYGRDSGVIMTGFLYASCILVPFYEVTYKLF